MINLKKSIRFLYLFISIMFIISCGNDRDPIAPDPVPCDPVPCEPVTCTVFDMKVIFSVDGNMSFPDVYAFERGGFPDEEIIITSRDTTFSRLLENYIREPFGLRKKSGSGAEIISTQVVSFKCAGGK